MSTTSLDDAVEHYKSQVPELIFEFRRRLVELRRGLEKEGILLTARYPDELFRLAEEEIRKRMRLAAESLRMAMDAGWIPNERNLQSDYTQCFALTDYRTDSFADINAVINSATNQLGRNDPELEAKYARHVGSVQSAASNQAVASLRMYARKKEAERSSSTEPPPVVKPERFEAVNDAASSNLVFITHGRDESSRDAVRSFVYDLGLKPIGIQVVVAGLSGQMGIPAPLVYLVIAVEFIGPILLVLGVLTRLVALGIAIDMGVAASLVHLPNGFFMNFSGKQAGEGIEFFILLVGIGVALVIGGPGRIALMKKI